MATFELEENIAFELSEMMVKYVVGMTKRVQRKSKDKDTLVKSSYEGLLS